MIAFGERVLQAALINGFDTFTANLATYVPDIFAQLATPEQTRITNWFSSATNKVQIIVGYPLTNQVMPQVAITLAAEDEPQDRQITGSLSQVQLGDATASPAVPFQMQMGAYFRSIYRFDCIGPNQEFVLWLQALVKWALLQQRLAIEVGYKLMNQKLTASDFTPYREGVEDEVIFPYQRTITLTADHVDTWNSVPTNTLINAINTTLTATAYSL